MLLLIKEIQLEFPQLQSFHLHILYKEKSFFLVLTNLTGTRMNLIVFVVKVP